MPIGFGFIQLGGQRLVEQPIVDGTLYPTLPARLTKGDQAFFPFSVRRT
jgi:hypothetical protein